MTPNNGKQRIAAAFKVAGSQKRAAVMPYLALGYPSPEESLEMVRAAVQGGADLIELGAPFSDPLADGPIIQQATQVALGKGMTLQRCLDMAQSLRGYGITTPFILMGYINPILAYGQERFCRACAGAGIDGLIVPDLPPEEGDVLENACRQNGLALIYLLAPTSRPERVDLVAAHSEGFVYLVAVKGVTGPREQISPDLEAFVKRVRTATNKPLAIGFGISNTQQARQAAVLADGVIVGSTLVRLSGEENGPQKVRDFVKSLYNAVQT